METPLHFYYVNAKVYFYSLKIVHLKPMTPGPKYNAKCWMQCKACRHWTQWSSGDMFSGVTNNDFLSGKPMGVFRFGGCQKNGPLVKSCPEPK